MAGDSDANLTGLAAEILRQAVQVFEHEDVVSWLVAASVVGMVGGGSMTGAIPIATGSFPAMTGAAPALTGGFPVITGAFASITGSLPALGHGNANAGAGLKKAFKLPRKLPGMRLPSEARLAALARSAPLMAELEALARWVGSEGRLVTTDGKLAAAPVADDAPRLHARRAHLPYLFDYALTARWLVLEDEPDRSRTWAVLGKTAWRWADGDDAGALHVWAAVFAAVLARTLEVAASANPRASRKLKFQGQGVAAAVALFLTRRSGLSGTDVRNLVRAGAIGDRPSARARRAWDGWVPGHGDPAQWLLSELATLRAIVPPRADDGTIELTPLALWALREQLRLDGVQIPLLKMTSAQMSAASLVSFADGASEAEAETEFASWVGARGQDRAARELLAFAAFSGPQRRLPAVNLVRRLGAGADLAWREATQRLELRGYARIALAALAADLPAGSMPPVPDPDPQDLARVANDLLALACGDGEPDPQEIAAQFSQAIPEDAQSWILGLMAQSSHPDVARVLMVLGRWHPDRRIAREARRAARSATRNGMVARADRVPARTSGHWGALPSPASAASKQVWRRGGRNNHRCRCARSQAPVGHGRLGNGRSLTGSRGRTPTRRR
jgi:hypothetical protein